MYVIVLILIYYNVSMFMCWMFGCVFILQYRVKNNSSLFVVKDVVVVLEKFVNLRLNMVVQIEVSLMRQICFFLKYVMVNYEMNMLMIVVVYRVMEKLKEMVGGIFVCWKKKVVYFINVVL